MTTVFRPYQLAAQEAVRDAWALRLDGDPHPMVVLGTGAGKTECALGLVAEAAERGERVVWAAHREELVQEPLVRLARGWPELARRGGIVQADRDDFDRQIVFASFPTLASGAGRLDRVLAAGPVDLLVVDEAHHSPSRSHSAVIDRILAQGARALALTATPDRDDGLDLADRWEIVYSYGLTDLIGAGYLVPPFTVVSRLPDLDLSKVSGRRDYDDAQLGAALLAAHVVEHTVKVLEETHLATRLPRSDATETRYLTARGRGVLVFTATVAQAEQTADALNAAGWRARAVSGETPREERRRFVRGFKRGDLDVLCNAAVFTEGTDLPRASCLVLARPTRSWSLFVQMMGRGLRLFEGKSDCLVIDLAGATEEHSLVGAPVLIGGSRCEKSPNGVHDFEPAPRDPHAGVCAHCQKRVACLEGALAGGAGGHEWDGDGHCKHCWRPQCPESPNIRHSWIPDYESDKPRRVCMWCDASVADPLGSLVSERSKKEGPNVPTSWLKLGGLQPETWAVHLDRHGSLFVLTEPEGFRPFWVPKRGRRARAITPGPIPRDQVRPLVDDIVRRAARVADPRDPSREIHGAYGVEVIANLTTRAVSLGLARPVPSPGRSS